MLDGVFEAEIDTDGDNVDNSVKLIRDVVVTIPLTLETGDALVDKVT